jgi:hypothetical protein
MTFAKLGPLVLVALLASGSGGCSSRSSTLPGRSGPFQRTRTPEALRVYEGPLSITVDAENGYGSLEIPQTGEKPLSLFIASEHLTKLETTDKARRHEVRYWYHDERWSSDLVMGRGELVSVRNPSGVILDPPSGADHLRPANGRLLEGDEPRFSASGLRTGRLLRGR